MSARCWVVMGPSGSGKSTLAAALAERLGWRFIEGDDHHPAANRAKMRCGEPLTDADRGPWLDALAAAIGECVAAGTDVVVTCSALRRRYRDRLRRAGASRFLLLDVPRDVLERRLRDRPVTMIRPDLLASQLGTLERPAGDELDVEVVAADRPVAAIADAVMPAPETPTLLPTSARRAASAARPGGAAPLVVTGAAGFIGARFVESCNVRGAPVVSVDRARSFASRPEHAGLDFGEAVDIEALAGWLDARREPIAGIVHMGAISDTTEMDVARLDRFNVAYSKHLWQVALERDVPYVYASSAAVYGDGTLGFDDDDALTAGLRPLNPYGESKRQFDLWALAESAAGRAPSAWAGFRFFNVYGFGERHKGPQASVVLHGYDQAKATGRIRLFRSHRSDIADGHQQRDFVEVGLAVAAIWHALERPIRRGIFNVGTGRARTFLDLARAVFAALGVPEAIEWVETPLAIRERYQYHTEARMDRLRAEGFSTSPVSLEEGVRHYVQRLERAQTADRRPDTDRTH